MDASPEQFVTLPSKVRICYQTIGKPSDPAVVLIMGHAASMLGWRDGLLELFSPPDDPHYLIRFDHRDTGLSTEFPVPGGYTITDMVQDIEGLVDHLGLSKGYHVVGASMGGFLANMIATRRPHQVKSLSLVYTSPGLSADLPINPEAQKISSGTLPTISHDKSSWIKHEMFVHDALSTQPLVGEERKEIEELSTRITERDMKGGTLFSKGPNHGAASYGNWPGVESLKNIKCPTVVIQAAKDLFFGPEHGEAMAKGIENSEYVFWDDVGHELPRRIWSRMAEVLLRTWKRGDEAWQLTAKS